MQDGQRGPRTVFDNVAKRGAEGRKWPLGPLFLTADLG